MCTKSYHDELSGNWLRFEAATLPGFIQRAGEFVWEARHCRRCHSSLPHPRDLARYGFTLGAP